MIIRRAMSRSGKWDTGVLGRRGRGKRVWVLVEIGERGVEYLRLSTGLNMGILGDWEEGWKVKMIRAVRIGGVAEREGRWEYQYEEEWQRSCILIHLSQHGR